MPKEHLLKLLPIVGVGAAVIVFCLGSVQLWQSLQTRSWPHADGVIRIAQVRKTGVSRYIAEISYDYQVGGVRYRGDRIGIGIRMGAKYSGRAQILLQDYSPGKPVPVFYAPAHPEDAVLQPGIFWGTWELFIISLVFFLFGCVPGWLARRMRNRRLRPG